MADAEDRDNGNDPTAPFDPTADLRVMASEQPHTPEQIAALVAVNAAAEDYFKDDLIDWHKLDALTIATQDCMDLHIDSATFDRVIRRAYLRSVAK